MKDVSKVMLLLAAGFAVGAVAGVLFAPEKGEKTREKLKEKAGELGEDIEDAYEEEMERLKVKIAQMKKRFSEEVSAAIDELSVEEDPINEN